MSSHREAPAISKDPVADSTDLYAFVSPDAPSMVTLIANYIPLEGPAGGPNFFEFGDDVSYAIHIDNDGDAKPDVTYWFNFRTVIRNPNTFLYNFGQITTIDSAVWNRPQFYTVSRAVEDEDPQVLASNLACPPCNVGPRSTPNYAGLRAAAVHSLPHGGKVFAGQRQDGFYVDLGSIFDLGALRPFQHLHLIPLPNVTPGVDSLRHLSVYSIALQVPISDLTRDGSSSFSGAGDARAAIGVWTAAYRRKARIRGAEASSDTESGPWVQVSRLGNPLFNEVIVPMAKKDFWNSTQPSQDSQFLSYVQHPELASLLPFLYPGNPPPASGTNVFPNLDKLNKSGAVRDDLQAILLTGIPAGIITGFQNFTGTTPADMLRLNMAIKPSSSPKIVGLLGGDPAGYPNGRRVFDDVVTIELRAVAGLTYQVVHGTGVFTADAAASVLYDVNNTNSPPVDYLDTFPYLNDPDSGFNFPS